MSAVGLAFAWEAWRRQRQTPTRTMPPSAITPTDSPQTFSPVASK